MSLIEQIEAEVQILRIRMERDDTKGTKDQALTIKQLMDEVLDPCNYTYSHTRYVCGRLSCRES